MPHMWPTATEGEAARPLLPRCFPQELPSGGDAPLDGWRLAAAPRRHSPSCSVEMSQGQGNALSVLLLRMLKMILNAYLWITEVRGRAAMGRRRGDGKRGSSRVGQRGGGGAGAGPLVPLPHVCLAFHARIHPRTAGRPRAAWPPPNSAQGISGAPWFRTTAGCTLAASGSSAPLAVRRRPSRLPQRSCAGAVRCRQTAAAVGELYRGGLLSHQGGMGARRAGTTRGSHLPPAHTPAAAALQARDERQCVPRAGRGSSARSMAPAGPCRGRGRGLLAAPPPASLLL
jgi:hypothetical protein